MIIMMYTKYGLEIINAIFPVFQKVIWDALYKMDDCFESAKLIQRYYNRAGIL